LSDEIYEDQYGEIYFLLKTFAT